jgi:hypothetical protein
MSIGTICYPAISKPEPEEKEVVSPFDSRDIAIYCLSGALILVVVALIIVLATRQQANYGMIRTV